MTNILVVLSFVLASAPAHADAFSELRRFVGPSPIDLVKVVPPVPVEIAVPATPSTPAPVVRVSSAKWDAAFPIAKDAVAAAGRKVGTKEWSSFSCEYRAGAASARCDFAYDVWPEMCWYGFDHVVADLDVKDPKTAKVVLKEWRRD